MSHTEAGQFENPTGINRFDDTVNFEGVDFEYTIFITPLIKGTEDYEWVVEHIKRRRQKGEPHKSCLGTTKSVIEQHLDEKITSAYGFVRQVGYGDEASGAIQIYDWSKKTRKPRKLQPTSFMRRSYSDQAWITDLCRHYDEKIERSRISPVRVLIHLFEQMTASLLNQLSINLMVENRNEEVLVPIYERYGFRRIEDKRFYNAKHILMRKPILRDRRYNDFPFGGIEEETPVMRPIRSRFTRSRRDSRISRSRRKTMKVNLIK
jgi:hypothetical protein